MPLLVNSLCIYTIFEPSSELYGYVTDMETSPTIFSGKLIMRTKGRADHLSKKRVKIARRRCCTVVGKFKRSRHRDDQLLTLLIT